MAKEALVTYTGEVTDVLPNATFKVLVETGHEIVAHLKGRLRQNKINIVTGDKVEVEMTPYDLSKGRITYRFKS